MEVAYNVVKDALVGRRRDALGQRDANVAVAGLPVKHLDARLAVRAFGRHRRDVRPVESLHQIHQRDGLVIVRRNCHQTKKKDPSINNSVQSMSSRSNVIPLLASILFLEYRIFLKKKKKRESNKQNMTRPDTRDGSLRAQNGSDFYCQQPPSSAISQQRIRLFSRHAPSRHQIASLLPSRRQDRFFFLLVVVVVSACCGVK